MKKLLQSWVEKARALVSQLQAKRRPQGGIAAMPGQANTVAGGKWSSLKSIRIDWEKLYRKSFVYNSVAAVICGYFAADLLVAGMTPWFPPTEAPRPRILQGETHNFPYYANLLLPKGRPNLFNEKGLVPDNDEGGPADLNGPPVKTSLPLNLLGVIVVHDPKKSVASVEDKGANTVVAVRIHEPITRDTEVLEITDVRVTFLNNGTGRREYIELPQDQILATRRAAPTRAAGGGGIQKTDDTHYHIDRKEVDKAMENLNTILTDARCVPEFEGGKPAGYRCFQITPGSVYDKLGLKDNDIICGLNGESINDPAKAFQVLSSLKDPATRQIQVSIKRGGGNCTSYSYDIN